MKDVMLWSGLTSFFDVSVYYGMGVGLVLHGRTHLVLPTLAIQNCEFVATLPLPP